MNDKRQIDLEQTEYRRAPRKGEPFFAPGAGQRIKWFLIMSAISVTIGAIMWVVVYLGIKPAFYAFFGLH